MNQLTDSKRKVKKRFPRAYCMKDGKRYYIFGNPPRDYTFGTIIRPYRNLIGEDHLGGGETEREAWEDAAT